MPQIVLKERTAHLARYTFFTRDADQYKNTSFPLLHQPHRTIFHRTLITSYFFPVNIANFLEAAFLENTSRSSGLQMFFKPGVCKSFGNFTGNHLYWSLFSKNLQAGGL